MSLDLHFTATELTDSPTQHLDQKQKTTNNSTQTQNESSHNEGILFPPSPTISLAQGDSSTPSSRTILKSFANKLENEYGDNPLVQQSLSSLYEAKQLWNDADSLANDVAYDFFSALKLDQIIEHNLAETQKPHSHLSSKDINSFTQQPHEYRISSYQAQQSQADTSTYNYNKYNQNFLASLFQISTLYYLVSFYILFTLLLWTIKFTLRFFP
ncbi:MAG: hypothetical protein GQ529_04845 [Methyloprofundus sp.]|nr:hypothetical protein [Methyloprofundus sp.]